MKNKKRTVAAAAMAAGLLVLILWQVGAFRTNLVPPGETSAAAEPAKGEVITLKETTIPALYHAVGTIHSRTEVEIAARITARVLTLKVRSGDRVKTGQILIELDKTDLAERLKQARQRVKEAEAAINAAEQSVKEMRALYDLAKKNYDRDSILFKKDVIPKKQFDATRSKYEAAMALLNRATEAKTRAEASLEAARAAVAEQQARLGYATITAPFDGVIAQQLADPGDLASPGVTLLTIFDPTKIMFYVPIREGLVEKVKVGDKIKVDVPAIGRVVGGVIREIVPSVSPASRTFLVKICLDKNAHLMPGMFGEINLDIGKRKALIIPDTAIERVGQLEYAKVVDNNGMAQRRLIRTAPYKPGLRRMVSGLTPGLRILKNTN